MDKSSSHAVTYPKIVNDIAVSVTDLDKAVKWYKEVFGFTVINGPVEFEADNSSLGMEMAQTSSFLTSKPAIM